MASQRATREASLFESALARLRQEPSLAEELCLSAGIWPSERLFDCAKTSLNCLRD